MPQSPDFPKRIPEKIRTIRERLGMTPDQIAAVVGAQTGADILAYENDEGDLLVTVLFGYARLANVPMRICYTMIAICDLGLA